MKRCRNSFRLWLNSIKHCSEVVSRLRLLSGVSKRGTHHADSFLMHKISCRIWPTRSFEMHTVSAISRIFNRRPWMFVTLSSVVVIFGAPGYGSSKTDLRRRWNSLNQFLMVAINGEESLYTASKTLWFCCAISLPKTRIESLTDIALFPFF